MGFLNRILKSSHFGASQPVSAADHWFLKHAGTRTHAGVDINAETALQVSTYYACIRIVAETIGHLPKYIYRPRKAGKGADLISDHPTNVVLQRETNPDMTPMTVFQTVAQHAVGWGNGYAELELDGKGRVRAIYPLMPDVTWPEREVDKRGIRYYHTIINGESRRIPSYRILHVPGLGYDGLVGYSPIHIMREALGLSRAAETFGAEFFGNGSRSGVVIKHPKVPNKEARDNIKEDWIDSNSGPENWHQPRVLIEGMDIEQITIPPEDAQFILTREFQKRDIATFMRMQLSKLGDMSNYNYKSLEHEAIVHVIDSILPWAVRFEQEMNRRFFTARDDRDLYVKLDLDELLRGDSLTRAQVLRTLTFASLITPDEGREELDYNPMGGRAAELQFPENMGTESSQSEESDRALDSRERVRDA